MQNLIDGYQHVSTCFNQVARNSFAGGSGDEVDWRLEGRVRWVRKWPVNVEIRPTGINRNGGWRERFDGCGNGGRIWKSALQELIILDVGGESSMGAELAGECGNPPDRN